MARFLQFPAGELRTTGRHRRRMARASVKSACYCFAAACCACSSAARIAIESGFTFCALRNSSMAPLVSPAARKIFPNATRDSTSSGEARRIFWYSRIAWDRSRAPSNAFARVRRPCKSPGCRTSARSSSPSAPGRSPSAIKCSAKEMCAAAVSDEAPKLGARADGGGSCAEASCLLAA